MQELNETQRAVQRSFRDFVDQRVLPQARNIDREQRFPMDLFREVAALGFFGMRYPEDAGGSGMDNISYALAVMELARGSLSLAATCTMQSLMGTHFLHRYGDDEMVERFFRPALRGEKICAICMTEPNAGSDLMAITTHARKTEQGFVLNGQKTWVTSAPVADFFTVLAKNEGLDGLSIFLVPADTPGLQVGKPIEKMGVRGSPTSELSFADVHIPLNHLLGPLGGGTTSLREILVEIRIMTAALAVGIAQAARDEAVKYSAERMQFGKPIAAFQAIQLKLAEMEMQLETARTYTLHVAALADRQEPRHKEAMIAKLYASEAACEICDQTARIMASYGYSTDFCAERLLRDVRFTLIGGGTSEILKINIAKEMKE
ncbi:MAG: Acyl-CoA dehydrogenase [Saprospiraceae bacterium]|nr:Acyl-CoA dehydrogenase [Saprospiraceae bacterium]